VAAPCRDRLKASRVIDGTKNGETFGPGVETQLLPTLRAGDVTMLDKLSGHKSQRAAGIPSDRGAWFLFLPPQAPDPTPIVMAFSTLESLIRKAAPR
jgi:transposase